MNISHPPTFARIYAEHHASITATARRILGDGTLAQDVSQDVFLKLWRQPDLFDPKRGDIGALLRTMARNRALDLHRSGVSARRLTERLGTLRAIERTYEDPVVAGERRCERVAVRAAVSRLPREQREALVLTYWGDLPDRDVARAAGVPLGTAKSRIRLGLRKVADDVGASLA
jgi:RNA polymerase sigma-70 factor (ECF subfamily)